MPEGTNQPADGPASRPTPSPGPGLSAGASHTVSRVIAFMNQKGGVGKTTSVVNIAAGIAQRGRSVLLVDMDPQAHSTISLGVDPAAQQASVYDVLLDPAFDALDALSVGARPHLAVLGSEVDLAAAETELAGIEDRNQRLVRALEPLKSVYEYILIDCPPSLGVLTLNALAAAREVIMPMQAHFLALQGVSKLLETVSLVSQGVNPRLKVSGVVLCMHDENTRHAREVVADLEQFFAQGRESGAPWWAARVYRPAVRRSIKLAESPGFGQTIFEYAPGSTGASDYQALADELIAEWDALTRPAPPEAKPQVVVRHEGKTKPARAGA